MAPDCNQVWTSDGGGEGGSVVGRRTSPNLNGWVRELHKGSCLRVCRNWVIV